MSPEEIDVLSELLVDGLRSAQLSAPRPDEREPAFTARVVSPAIAEILKRTAVHGLTHAGDGGAPLLPTYLFGLSFRPDGGVAYHGKPVVAFEVKFLRKSHRQQALCTAVGQSVLYRAQRYPKVITLLVDLGGGATEGEVAELRQSLSALELTLLYYRRRRSALHAG